MSDGPLRRLRGAAPKTELFPANIRSSMRPQMWYGSFKTPARCRYRAAHQHSLSSVLGEKGSLGPHEKEFFFVRTRQDVDLRGLQPGVRVYCERAAVLRRPTVQRAATLPLVPSRQEGRARRRRRQQLLRRRLLKRTARDVQRNVLELRPRGPGPLPPERRKARLLQRLLQQPARFEQPLVLLAREATRRSPMTSGSS
jgi:hypothetical protein